METQDIIEEIKKTIIEATKLVEKPLKYGSDFKIINQQMGKEPIKLEKGYAAIYMFFWKNHNEFLKIGQVGPKSNARYQYQHYKTFRKRHSVSTLSRSIVDDSLMKYLKLNDNNVGNWIKKNCERYDILIDSKYEKIVRNFIEGLFQYKFNPRYEG